METTNEDTVLETTYLKLKPTQNTTEKSFKLTPELSEKIKKQLENDDKITTKEAKTKLKKYIEDLYIYIFRQILFC